MNWENVRRGVASFRGLKSTIQDTDAAETLGTAIAFWAMNLARGGEKERARAIARGYAAALRFADVFGGTRSPLGGEVYCAFKSAFLCFQYGASTEAILVLMKEKREMRKGA